MVFYRCWLSQIPEEQRHSHFSFFSHSFPEFSCISPGLLLSHFGNRGQGLMKVCLRNKVVDFRSSLSRKNLFMLLCIENTDINIDERIKLECGESRKDTLAGLIYRPSVFSELGKLLFFIPVIEWSLQTI